MGYINGYYTHTQVWSNHFDGLVNLNEILDAFTNISYQL